ncbi:SMP-30/gluconolactonase/LRE family protein [Acuticoccus mangrovi]|uniref:SMP-30/gluconolactonase/LRE family protein n=1 Tax=Acuticoccus mangrovi TaxID=2796142 RepID=A0A934MJF5_9HYPH|nr:SMP-30/gluconolactonase/LRE family protein [Acuticoccus mangrovi]MBJ3774509.1 SMP-30/gluconolactonase/LRE family protein [Acuticoccus mangrovi]
MVKVECVHDAGAKLGESPVWDDQEGVLYWADIDAGLLHAFDPVSGPRAPIAIGERLGCFALRAGGGAIMGTESGIYYYDFGTGERSLLAAPEQDRPENRFNDSATDRDGRWWLGSYGMMKPQRAEAAFYRVDPDGTVTKWLDGVYTTNGLAFSPDGTTMYLSDSHRDVRTVWACDYDRDTGTPTDRRVFFDTREVVGRPDGGTVDADGCYWMAGVAGSQLVRITPAGKVDMIIELPVERPTKPMFGGPGLDTLYLTSIGGAAYDPVPPLAGGLFAVTGLPAKGIPETRFAG